MTKKELVKKLDNIINEIDNIQEALNNQREKFLKILNDLVKITDFIEME